MRYIAFDLPQHCSHLSSLREDPQISHFSCVCPAVVGQNGNRGSMTLMLILNFRIVCVEVWLSSLALSGYPGFCTSQYIAMSTATSGPIYASLTAIRLVMAKVEALTSMFLLTKCVVFVHESCSNTVLPCRRLTSMI